MKTLPLGFLASLLSAATALIIVHTGASGAHPLYLLLAQYLVGVLFAPPRRLPVAPVRLHVYRLVSGLWAFGGYYLALSSVGARPAEFSMILNTAPVFATFYAVRNFKTRMGALLAFAGVAMAFANKGEMGSVSWAHFMVLSSAVAYAASFIVLGTLSQRGESSITTNSLYNLGAGLCTVGLLGIAQPPLPSVWWPVFAVGIIAAIRIQILTVAAVNPEESARVSVLTSLAFLWLALAEALQGKPPSGLEWGALGCVIAGVILGSRLSVKIERCPSRFARTT